jgi:hypothetical protein
MVTGVKLYKNANAGVSETAFMDIDILWGGNQASLSDFSSRYLLLLIYTHLATRLESVLHSFFHLRMAGKATVGFGASQRRFYDSESLPAWLSSTPDSPWYTFVSSGKDLFALKSKLHMHTHRQLRLPQ